MSHRMRFCYISSDTKHLQQVVSLKDMISQFDNKETNLSVSFEIFEVSEMVHALRKKVTRPVQYICAFAFTIADILR